MQAKNSKESCQFMSPRFESFDLEFSGWTLASIESITVTIEASKGRHPLEAWSPGHSCVPLLKLFNLLCCQR